MNKMRKCTKSRMLEGVTLYRQCTWGGSCFFQMTFHSSFLKELTLHKFDRGYQTPQICLCLFLFISVWISFQLVRFRRRMIFVDLSTLPIEEGVDFLTSWSQGSLGLVCVDSAGISNCILILLILEEISQGIFTRDFQIYLSYITYHKYHIIYIYNSPKKK